MRVFVQNLAFDGRHGVYEEERRDGRRFEVDLSAHLPRVRAGQSDALADTLDYRELASIVLEAGHGPSVLLVERLAQDILDRVFSRYPQVDEAEITIRKYATGVPGEPLCVGIALSLRRADWAALPTSS